MSPGRPHRWMATDPDPGNGPVNRTPPTGRLTASSPPHRRQYAADPVLSSTVGERRRPICAVSSSRDGGSTRRPAEDPSVRGGIRRSEIQGWMKATSATLGPGSVEVTGRPRRWLGGDRHAGMTATPRHQRQGSDGGNAPQRCPYIPHTPQTLPAPQTFRTIHLHGHARPESRRNGDGSGV